MASMNLLYPDTNNYRRKFAERGYLLEHWSIDFHKLPHEVFYVLGSNGETTELFFKPHTGYAEITLTKYKKHMDIASAIEFVELELGRQFEHFDIIEYRAGLVKDESIVSTSPGIRYSKAQLSISFRFSRMLSNEKPEPTTVAPARTPQPHDIEVEDFTGLVVAEDTDIEL